MPQTIHKDSLNLDGNESQMVKDDDDNNNKLVVYASKDIDTISEQKDDQEIF